MVHHVDFLNLNFSAGSMLLFLHYLNKTRTSLKLARTLVSVALAKETRLLGRELGGGGGGGGGGMNAWRAQRVSA